MTMHRCGDMTGSDVSVAPEEASAATHNLSPQSLTLFERSWQS